MDAEHVNKWVTLMANIGVLAGIIFLALEIQQSNRIAISAAEMGIRDHYLTHNELVLTEDPIAELLVKAMDFDAEFSAVEATKLDAFLFININTWRAIEIAYSNGLLPLHTFQTIESEISWMLRTYPAVRPFMQSAVDEYPAQDSRHVTEAMRRALLEFD